MKCKIKGNKYFILGIILLLILSILFFIYEENSKFNLNKENELYKIILKADRRMSEVSLDSQKAENFYDEASFFYENQEWKLVENNCRSARDYYSRESQGYKKIKSEMLSSDIKDKLIDIYILSLDSIIEMKDNLYEACEHFESAVRYYDKYYNDIYSPESNYNMGTGKIDMMNKNIKAHDNAVGKYNQYLEDFRLELDKRI